MAVADFDADPPGWGQPLGRGLPPAGAPKIRWALIIMGAIAILGVVAGAGCFLYPYAVPAVVLGERISQHETLRDAALAWRAHHAKDPAAAMGMEIWQRGTASASWCRRPMRADVDPGDYMLVRPSSQEAGAESIKTAHRVVTSASLTWSPALRTLAPQLQSGRLGEEALSRGSVLVELKPAQTGANVLVASEASPAEGHANTGAVSLAPVTGCLPLLSEEHQGALLASPDPQPLTSGRYWLARNTGGVSLLKAAPCAATGTEPIERRSYALPASVLPLLSFSGAKDQSTAHLLVLPTPGATAKPMLLRAPPFNPTSIEVLGAIDADGVDRPGSGQVPASELYDSFQVGLPGDAPAVSVPVRRVVEGAVRYLVETPEGLVFDDCPKPAPHRYFVVSDSCGQKGGEYINLDVNQVHGLGRCSDVRESKAGSFDESLGPNPGNKRRSRTQCVSQRAYVHEEYPDLDCDLLVTPARCVGEAQGEE